MKNLNIVRGLLLLSIILGSACSEMNDLHDVYLKDGEKIYVGRIDSLKAFSGRERSLIQYWITDPRVKSLHILWNQRQDSIVVPVPAHDPADSIEFIIGDGNGIIEEGDHTVFIYSYDDKGHRSIKFETLVNVYGDRYQATLMNRPVSSVVLKEDNSLTITWSGSFSKDEIGIQMSYLDNSGKPVESIIPSNILAKPVVFNDINVTKPISYKTLYTPEKFAIDTFYTEVEPIKVIIKNNVASKKNTIVSDMLNSSYPGANAVDGVISSASRWVSGTTGAHWIEVDLGQPFPIQSFKTYNGSGDAANIAIKEFMFQANVNGEWVTIVNVKNNSNHSYGATFEEVITDKVRLFVPDYPDNQVRLFELEVYSTRSIN